jgi:serine/threonine-protein kinase
MTIEATAPTAVPLFQPGQAVGGYQIEAVLGSGGVADVYRARTASGEQVVLKVLNRTAAAQAKIRLLFRQEYELVARLRHPGVVQMLGTGQIETYPYIAMPFVEGETLEAFLVKHPKLGEAASVDIGRQLATTLDYVHSQGIVHRDLKPGNVLLTQDGRALLFDFGTALNLRSGAIDEGGIYGTPAFLAPEQVRNSATVDGRADLYSLGVLLYRMVSGRKPFYGGRSEVLEAHLHEPPPPPSEFAYVSPELEAVILKTLAKTPAERFQSGAELAAALMAVHLVDPPERVPLSRRLLQWLRGTPAPATTGVTGSGSAAMIQPRGSPTAVAQISPADSDRR